MNVAEEREREREGERARANDLFAKQTGFSYLPLVCKRQLPPALIFSLSPSPPGHAYDPNLLSM